MDEELKSVTCHLFDKDETDSEQNRRKNLILYTSAGLFPTIEIFNSSYSKVFSFKRLLAEDQSTWSLEIPRHDIAHNTDIAPIEQWYAKFDMHHGLHMFTTEGTVLDVAREPILQWTFKEVNITALIPNVINMIVTKSPCASDVAILGLSFNNKAKDCDDLQLLNVVLTNTRIVFLTTLGLFISEDLRYGNFSELKFDKPNFCGFEMDDYMKAKIWYSVQCLANQENYEVDYISLTFNKLKTLSQESTCFYSNDPYKNWRTCLPRKKQGEKSVARQAISFLIDYQQNTGIALLNHQDRELVMVTKLTNHRLHRRIKFPAFWFPDAEFVPTGLVFYPNSHFLYAYGNQVWFSEDGGNHFELIINVANEMVVKTDACVYNQAVIFVTDRGTVFYTKAVSTAIKANASSGVSQRRYNIQITRRRSTSVGQAACGVMCSVLESHLKKDVDRMKQEDDLAFDGPLAPQYITEEQMMFFSHSLLNPQGNETEPRFYNLYIGKALKYGLGGSGIISKVYEHDDPPEFLTSVFVEVLDRFPVEASTSSPCVLNTLTILPPDPDTTAFKLQLSPSNTHIFQASDVEKTVVIPGFSSFLITEVIDDHNALADATMPNRAPTNIAFESRRWFLYDFGTTNGRKWRVTVDRCRYTMQQLDDLPVHSIKYLDLGSKVDFSFRVTPVNVAHQIFQMHQAEVIVGNPNLLDMNIEEYWDNTDSYIIKLQVQSRFFDQGKTSISVIIVQASLVCDVTTLILTLRNSCSYLKVMHYTLPVQLSASDWLSQRANASKYLKNLPVNYRPPSKLGIAVPLTENFYNADPAKPRRRDYFPGSKASGTYKQCADKKKRSECGCTNNMKLSFYVAFSDCKEKAIRMKYPVVKLPLHFTVENENGIVNLSSPYFITIKEVNNRTNWEIIDANQTSSLLKMRRYLADTLDATLYTPEGLTLYIHGSELFHFRVATVHGVSFCSLFDEFQIYVDDAPLAFPGQYLISSITTVLLGLFVFVVFIVEAYEINVWSFLKKKLGVSVKKSIVSVISPSTTSIENTEKLLPEVPGSAI
ncbi:cation channel sperm-associated auxiliary subunit beta [Sphaerodactylus townsendi]|uniref:cation channel sperm-associated auxiliary subunit beta n=1 Tax=Sphaerodactylus townsendi TaxID=933632 RepID=UPI002026EC2F|nr:cation channel sperm-associated auxiliary subunit beta [Sphaerodactylus townsendi]